MAKKKRYSVEKIMLVYKIRKILNTRIMVFKQEIAVDRLNGDTPVILFHVFPKCNLIRCPGFSGQVL